MRKFAHVIGAGWLAISVGFILVTVITVICQVAFRYLLALPLAWTEEVSRMALVGAVYAGLPAAYLRGEHIVVDFFVSLLPGWLFQPYVIAMKLICVVTLSYLTYGAFLQIDGTQGMTLIALPTFPVSAIYAVQAAALFSFTLLILLTLRDPRTYVAQELGLDS